MIGAGMAGLLAAAAAAQTGHGVLLLERDVLTAEAGDRPGVPQSRQPHVYLREGLMAAEDLLPGLTADLQRSGGVPFDTGRLAWLGETGWAPVASSDAQVVSLSRPLFEQVVRRRVLDLDGVQLRSGCRATGLKRSGHRWRVGTDTGWIDADLVIDASGRGSRMPVWLTQLGYAAPTVTTVDARMGYATREYSSAPSLGALTGIVVQCTPASPVGGLALPVENGHWLVLASGMGEHRPPRDNAGFEAFLRTLPDPGIADFTARATPCSNVAVHRQTANRKMHYEAAAKWPEGLLVLGDALVCFNPVFGQGVTVAAGEAVVLRDALAAGMLPRESRLVMRRFAKVAALPWSIAVGQDLRQPSSVGELSRSQKLLDSWAREVSTLAVHGNAQALRSLTRLYHLVGSPASLMHPALVGAAVRGRLRGYGPATVRPPPLAALVEA